LYVDPNLAITQWKETMRQAERRAELQRMLPPRERRRRPHIHVAFPTIRRRTRLATPHGC
jgi:hypothetical protein